MIKDWQRITFDGTPIYIRPESPDWFVPNKKADQLLQRLKQDKTSPHTLELRMLLNRIDGKSNYGYKGRGEILHPGRLRECWIHITNRCNLHCTHCMFSSSPSSLHELSADEVHGLLDEALRLGCKIFYFTGGEPFLHQTLFPALEKIFDVSDTHVVMLTNLTLIADNANNLKTFPKDRLHFQISVDGIDANHDLIRGKGTLERLKKNLKALSRLNFPVTMAMTITKKNVAEMETVVDFADGNGISNIHFLWLFKKGLADDSLMASTDDIFLNLIKAQKRAEQRGIRIDNIEIFRSQVFSFPGTKYDLSNAGWQSLAVGPDSFIYPSPALIYTKDMQCGRLNEGLEHVWKTSSVLKTIRNASLNDTLTLRKNPLKYLVGGSDIDHSYIHGGKITGCDPYIELYNNIVKWLIVEEAKKYQSGSRLPAFQLKMGEKLGECPPEETEGFFTHSNCVLSLPGHDTHTLVNAFYTEAAESPKDDILNPVCYSEALISHIPEESRFRGYGCGSPVEDARLVPGEKVVDLGSGTGIECFIASRMVGRTGKVIGIDMGDAMLKIAHRTMQHVEKNLGYSNITFKKAFLEALPLKNDSVDVVISNCVINLSPDKRKVFSEIMRVLKPGGRFIISDITYDDDIPLSVKYNEKLRGECLGGALRYHDLFGLLDDLGCADSRIIGAFLYRNVKGFDFYSITYEAFRPGGKKKHVIAERPAFKEILKSVLTTPSCACFVKLEQVHLTKEQPTAAHPSGCMVCGEPLDYFGKDLTLECFYCGKRKKANAGCKNGHFVCDECHSADAIKILKQVCLNTEESDMILLMKKVRAYPSFPIHGPEHHSLVPAVILAAYRNSGGKLSDDRLMSGIDRGSTVPGGSCAFMGACGAAIGVGIAFSVILEANPYKATIRQAVQRVTQEILGEIARFEAARCCQRDSWTALKGAAKLSEMNLGIALKADTNLICSQFNKNKECIKSLCPLWPRKK